MLGTLANTSKLDFSSGAAHTKAFPLYHHNRRPDEAKKNAENERKCSTPLPPPHPYGLDMGGRWGYGWHQVPEFLNMHLAII